MPGFDGTGPLGKGAMTGWGRGYCVQPYHPETGRFYFGRGGRGRGFRHRRLWETGLVSPEEVDRGSLDELRNQIGLLQEQVFKLTERFDNLEGINKEGEQK